METVSAPCSPEKSVPAQKAFKNPIRRKNHRGSVQRKSAENLGMPYLPPPQPPHIIWSSASPFLLPTSNNSYSQPPLLPLPRVNSSLPQPRVHSSLPPLSRGVSCIPRTAGKVTEKQRKTFQVLNSDPKLTRTGSVPVGSYPGEIPNGFNGYPCPSFTLLSPPPSSLPMPRFSIKPKMSCYAEAAGTEDGATNDLRRLLRLP